MKLLGPDLSKQNADGSGFDEVLRQGCKLSQVCCSDFGAGFGGLPVFFSTKFLNKSRSAHFVDVAEIESFLNKAKMEEIF